MVRKQIIQLETRQYKFTSKEGGEELRRSYLILHETLKFSHGAGTGSNTTVGRCKLLGERNMQRGTKGRMHSKYVTRRICRLKQ